MGIAEVIPGVSGGTIAFITGIYEQLIDSIKAFGPEAIKAFRKDGIGGAWKAVHGNFLLFLLAGMAVGVVIGVFVITHFLEHYPVLLWAFFFGLIIASAIYIFRQITHWTYVEVIALIAGILIAYFITIASPTEGNRALWFVFLSGVIAISALILPGISGSFILLLLGMYTYIIPTLKEAIKTRQLDDLLVVGVFGMGCIVGLATFSRILSWTFKNYLRPTLAVLTGFMIGSLNKIWPWRMPVKGLDEEGNMISWIKGTELDKVIEEVNLLPSTYAEKVGDPYTLWVILLMIFGFLMVFGLERLGRSSDIVHE